MTLLFIFFVFLITVTNSKIHNCVWSPGHKYCLSYLSSESVHITVDNGERNTTEEDSIVFPDDEFYTHLGDYQAKASQVTEIDFGTFCNVTFNNSLLNSRHLTGVNSINFDEKCLEFSEKHKFCLDLDDNWPKTLLVANIRMCKMPKRFSYLETSGSKNDQDFVTIEIHQDDHDLIQMLNSSLQRTMHLYEVTEHSNRILSQKITDLERNFHQCQISRNESLDLANYSRRQFGKCMDTRLRDRRIKMERVKELVETIYDGILDILHLD